MSENDRFDREFEDSDDEFSVDLPLGTYKTVLVGVYPSSEKFASGDYKATWGVSISPKVKITDGTYSGFCHDIRFKIRNKDGQDVKPQIKKLRLFCATLGKTITGPMSAIKAIEEALKTQPELLVEIYPGNDPKYTETRVTLITPAMSLTKPSEQPNGSSSDPEDDGGMPF